MPLTTEEVASVAMCDAIRAGQSADANSRRLDLLARAIQALHDRDRAYTVDGVDPVQALLDEERRLAAKRSR